MASHLSKRRKTNDSSDEPQLIDIAKGGDLVLKVGGGNQSGTRLIQVHSLCLKLASPVFHAMLESSFLEGTTKHTTEQPLLLPEDHGPTFVEMCKILHHQQTQPSRLSLLSDLVVVADKYQCTDSIRTYVLSAIGPFFSSTAIEGDTGIVSSGLNLVSAMCIAYIIKDAQLFHRTSASVLINVSCDNIEDESEKFLDIFLEGLIGQTHLYLLIDADADGL